MIYCIQGLRVAQKFTLPIFVKIGIGVVFNIANLVVIFKFFDVDFKFSLFFQLLC